MQRSTEQQSGRQHERVQKLVQQFLTAWKDAADVDLRAFLPPADDPLRKPALIELIKADLRVRWQRRRGKPLESYVDRFPELGALENLSPEMLLEEYQVRQLFGEAPELQSYRERFPKQYSAFEPLAREHPTFSRLEDTNSVSAPPQAPEAALGSTLPATSVPVSAPTPAAVKGASQTSQLIGDYQWSKRLGQGSFAEVYQGIAPGGFPVAIKRVTTPMEDEEAQRELQALKAISDLRHPFLLQTHSSFILDGHLIVVMELADGTLRDRQKACQKAGGLIPLPELIRYFREAAEGLDYMHSKHLIHRDIKPQNILLLHGHAKLADYGLALVQASQRALFTATSSGTPAYMAPEVWRSKISPHSDQYSLAFAYAEQRLGKLAFDAADIVSLMMAHTTEEPNLADLPVDEQIVLKKALAKDPAERFPNCLEFVGALEVALRDQLRLANPTMMPDRDRKTVELHMGTLSPGAPGLESAAAIAQTQPSWVAQGRGNRRPLLLTAFLVAALLVVGGWFAFTELRSTLAVEAPARLTLHPGEVKAVRVQLKRHRLDKPVRLTWSGLPDNCQAAEATVGGDDNSIEVPVVVAPDAPPGTKSVTVRASADGIERESTFELNIEPPPQYALPAGWVKAKDAVLKSVDGRAYYDKIDVVRDGIPVRFLLMAKTGKDDPDTFYIMQDKVWVGLFRKFTEQAAAEKPPLESPWEKSIQNGQVDKDEFPVLKVFPDEADRCAAWLGGKLPLPNEWDKAAGFYDERKGGGPYDPSYDPKQDGKDHIEIAVGRTTPMPRGQARKDVSPLGCRDMAGNGKEWTGATTDDWAPPRPKRSTREALADKDNFIFVRSRDYGEASPYSWEDIAKGGAPLNGGHTPGSVGFRVVLEP